MHRACMHVNAHTQETHWHQHTGFWSTETSLRDVNILGTEWNLDPMVALKPPVQGSSESGQSWWAT